MKKLELRDIAGYLPYRLLWLSDETETRTPTVHGKNFLRLKDIARTEDKPILRPMSDLTREITHRGKKFIPEKVLEWELRNDEYGKVIDFGDNHSGCILPWDWLDELDLLNEWMFDYRDLIGQGLAIDVNTLKENCYE